MSDDVERFRIQPIPRESYLRERTRVLSTLAAGVPWADVREVGSTALEGVTGKGDIDVLVRVPEADFARTRAALDARFSRNPRQMSNAQYQGYSVESELDVAIQLTVCGCIHDNFVAFLDALAADPVLVQRYNALKRAWDGQPMDAYRAAKAAFIHEVLDRAR